jgi:hypothetical protein
MPNPFTCASGLRWRDLPPALRLRVPVRRANARGRRGRDDPLGVPFLFVTTASRISDQLVEMRAASRGRHVRLVDT